MKVVEPVPCQHIADYYAHRQAENPSLGNNLLRRGYQQFAMGKIVDGIRLNLYRPTIKFQRQTPSFVHNIPGKLKCS